MIDYKLYQNLNQTSKCYKLYYARTVASETIDITKLAKHMSNHNTPYSSGTIKGILTDMVGCIKELLLDGKSVRIDNLAIFSVGISCVGAASPSAFSISGNVKDIHLNARPTGELSTSILKLDSQLCQLPEYTKPTDAPAADGTTTGTGTGN
jgi:predicted histone-like DNA-binding protein